MKKRVSLLTVAVMMTFLLQVVAYAAAASAPERQEITEEGNGEVILIEDTEAWEQLISDDSSGELVGESEGYAPEDAEKAIFGKDNRVTVSNPASYPFRTIAWMQAKAECGCTWQASGFMIGRNRMLTAAHCLVCPDHGKWAKTIDFYFGYKNAKNYYYKYSGSWRAWVGNAFKSGTGYSTYEDYGCITFDSNVGDTTGWIGYRYGMPDDELLSQYVYASGYRDGLLKYDTGWIQGADKDYVTYLMDDVPGNSGGPLFFLDSDGDYKAVAIIVAENNLNNVGYRLSAKVINSFDIESIVIK